MLAAAAMSAGCDYSRIDKLEEGVSSEADVRKQFGEPAAVYDEPGGARTFEYPRQPEGRVNYMITIGADGKMSALRQVLKPSEFDRVKPGLDKSQVRRILGRPALTRRFDRQNIESWEWRWDESPVRKIFSVNFDADGRVTSTAVSEEPERSSSGGQ